MSLWRCWGIQFSELRLLYKNIWTWWWVSLLGSLLFLSWISDIKRTESTQSAYSWEELIELYWTLRKIAIIKTFIRFLNKLILQHWPMHKNCLLQWTKSFEMQANISARMQVLYKTNGSRKTVVNIRQRSFCEHNYSEQVSIRRLLKRLDNNHLEGESFYLTDEVMKQF